MGLNHLLQKIAVKVFKVGDCLAKVEYNGTQYFFLCKIMKGIFGTGTGEEYIDMERNRGTYLPVWLDINKLASVDVRPKEVALIVQSLFSTAK